MTAAPPNVVVTGADGFIGKNLIVRLSERNIVAHAIGRGMSAADAADKLARADVIFHLAGANRPANPSGFQVDNVDLTVQLVDAVRAGGRRPLVIFASTMKATDPSPYGLSKRSAENILAAAETDGECVALAYRLPNVFGKWCRPNYNSAIATFCHNVARGLPIEVHDPSAPVSLLYIDDLIDRWLLLIDDRPGAGGVISVDDAYTNTIGVIAETIAGFGAGRQEARIDGVGSGLTRALYSTFISYLPPEAFSYPIEAHRDPRGSFSEMLKTADSGQFSFFTAHPGVTRGGHYHHSKVEKFLIVSGEARFRFRHILTGEAHDVITSAARPVVVETIPGWTHDVTNVGETELVAMLWANEVFDRARPDTVQEPV